MFFSIILRFQGRNNNGQFSCGHNYNTKEKEKACEQQTSRKNINKEIVC